MATARRHETTENPIARRAVDGYLVKTTYILFAVASLIAGGALTYRTWRRAAPPVNAGDLSTVARFVHSVLTSIGFDATDGIVQARMLTVVLFNLLLLVVTLVTLKLLAPKIRRLIAQWDSRPGEHLVILLTRNSRATGWMLLLSSITILIGAPILFPWTATPGLLVWLPLLIGFCAAIIDLGAATLIDMPIILAPGQALRLDETVPPHAGPARISGEEFVNRLRQSPIFRRQIHFDNVLRTTPFVGGPNGVEQFLRRFPRMEAVLRDIGIETFSADQTTAINRILENEKTGKPMDQLFIGRPGSGRTTVANLLALGAAVQKEGAIYCITPESPDQLVDYDSEHDRRAVRHAATQLREWIRRSRLTDTVSVTESYRASQAPGDIDTDADIIVTDARMFSSASEARETRFLARLRYVIVDQPERLSREDFVKLRIALCRLRLVADLMGRPLTFIVILPRLNNQVEVAKYLLNHANVEPTHFGSWAGPCHIVGWMPALEIANPSEEIPCFARANFIDEVTALLAEIGAQANDLAETIRVAVIDAQPLLGPEAREFIRETVRDQLARVQRDHPLVMRTSWTYFTSTDVGVERQGEYDVVICLGAGRHPRETIASLRPAVAFDGAVIIIADSSPADLDTFDVMAAPGWTPELEDTRRRYPTLLLPDHSDAVLAFELARLFEDFAASPLPVDRLLQVFPGRGVAALLEEWKEEGHLRETQVFEDLRLGNWPSRRECLIRMNPAFGADLFEIPWGCCSRSVYDIHDKAANRQVMAGPYLNDWIDEDRLFIDFHPMAALRYRPNSVLVRRAVRRDDNTDGSDYRFKHRGTVDIEQMLRDDAIRIDRRMPRIRAEITAEWSPDQDAASAAVEPESVIGSMGPLLYPRQGSESTDATDAILQRLSRLQVGTGSSASIALLGGEWYTIVREQIRDVVRTDARLVEEPEFTTALVVPAGSTIEREYECLAISLFLHRRHAGLASGDAGNRPSYAPSDAMADYASHHALARVMSEFLRRDFLNFDREYRIAVLPNPQKHESVSPFRIVVYKLRSNELGWDHTLASILEPEDLHDLMDWMHERLESCDCRDGCSRCCGGLGTTPVSSSLPHFTAEDQISRSGAYLLTCGLLGRSPDWERFGEDALAGRTDQRISDRQLARFVEELIGTEAGNFLDGLWHRLFGQHMTLDRSFVAAATWMDGENDRPDCAGYYNSASNVVFIRPGPTLSYLRETIFHEFVHNWQFRSDVFDIATHLQSPTVRQYYDGKLIIEGHAVWSEQIYRLSERRGAVYSPGDGHPWNEYKAGFLLMEAIEKVVGQDGLFAWLSRGKKPEHIRSRDPRIRWPFTLDEAIDKLNLRRYMRRQALTGFDVAENDTSNEEGPATQSASADL